MGNDQLKHRLIERLNFVENRGKEALDTRETHGSETTIKSAQFYGFRSSALSFIESILGESSSYFKEFNRKTNYADYYNLLSGIEILKSIRAEIENDWLISFKGIISAEIFSDFLEMAEHLLENGYKDASAVIIGSVLEEHLRQLCSKNNIEISIEKGDILMPKKADRLNSDLCSAEVYNRLDQKAITSWLDLRNKAAHGKYSEYELAQVRVMYSGVSEFMMRNQI